MKRTSLWYRMGLWVLTVATAVLILSFSLQPADDSGALSTSLTHSLLSCFPSYRELSPSQQEAACLSANEPIRAIAHITEFTVLGFFLSLLCHSYRPRRWAIPALPVGILFAIADECVQEWCSAGRAMQLVDLFKDWTGCLIGTAVAYGTIRRIRRCLSRRHRHHGAA